MTAVDVLHEARAAGVSVEAKGDRLRVHGRGHLPDHLLYRLREHRDGVLEELRREAATTQNTVPAPGEDTPSRSESALVYVPSLGWELWIASDATEAGQLRRDLAAEGNDRPIIVAADVAKLQGEPQVEVDAAVRALAAFPGARVVYAGPIKEREIVAKSGKDDAATEPAPRSGTAARDRGDARPSGVTPEKGTTR